MARVSALISLVIAILALLVLLLELFAPQIVPIVAPAPIWERSASRLICSA